MVSANPKPRNKARGGDTNGVKHTIPVNRKLIFKDLLLLCLNFSLLFCLTVSIFIFACLFDSAKIK